MKFQVSRTVGHVEWQTFTTVPMECIAFVFIVKHVQKKVKVKPTPLEP